MVSYSGLIDAPCTRCAGDTQYLHKLFDVLDVFCVATSNDLNKEKTIGFYIGSGRLAQHPWPGAALKGAQGTYKPTQESEPRARLRWLVKDEAWGTNLGINVGPSMHRYMVL